MLADGLGGSIYRHRSRQVCGDVRVVQALLNNTDVDHNPDNHRSLYHDCCSGSIFLHYGAFLVPRKACLPYESLYSSYLQAHHSRMTA